MRRVLVAICFALALGAYARANQSNAWSPTVGIVSGLQLTLNYNNGFSAVLSNNSGGSAPTNDQTGSTVTGQWWLNTSTTPNALQMFTGAAWGTVGWLDSPNQQWISSIAGAATTIASAATTDLCNGSGLTPSPSIIISGAASITSFGATCPRGQVKFIVFSGAPTIVSNPTLIVLPNATSITAGAGDTMVISHNGSGVWTSISYQPFIPVAVNLNTIGSFWTDVTDADGSMNARINAFRDRVFVDDGALQTGAWNGGAGGLASSRSGTEINSVGWNWPSRDGSLVSISSWGGLAVVGQSVSSRACRSGDPHLPSCPFASAIGVAGFGLNDRTTSIQTSWGGYYEVLRASSSVGTGLAIESDAGNFGAVVDLTPWTNPTGTTGHTTNLWAQCGGSATGSSYNNCTAGLAFGNNGARYRKGILFFGAALDLSVGAGGGGVALELADSQSMRWIRADGAVIGELWTSGANSGTMFLSPAINLQINGANSWNGDAGVSVALGNVGPSGAHSTPQNWLVVYDNTGTIRYIPAF